MDGIDVRIVISAITFNSYIFIDHPFVEMNRRGYSTFFIPLSILLIAHCDGNLTDDVGCTSSLSPLEISTIIGGEYSYNVSDKVNVNKIFDDILPKVRDYLIKKGMEPISLPDYVINTLRLPGIFNGKINLRHGFLHYITDVKRSKNIMLQYNHKRLLFDIPLRWQRLDFNYDYDFMYSFLTKRGEIYGRIDDADFDISYEIDLNKYEMILHHIRIHRIDSLNLQVRTNKLDPVMNILTSTVTRFFKNRIIKLVEEESTKALQPFINEMNKRIKRKNHRVKNLIASF